MAATVLPLAAAVSSFLSRNENHRSSSSSLILFNSLSLSSSSSSSSSSPRFPSISFTTAPVISPNRCVFAACLPSTPPPAPKSASTPSTKLYVSGLSFRTTEESLRNAFQNFGQLVEVNLVMDRVANRPRGFAFLRYAMEEESKKAIEGMHGKFLDGRVIFVEVAKTRSELRQNVKQNPRLY